MTTRALVIEDSPEIAALIAKLLGNEGFTVSATPSGKMGIAKARAERPEIVVLDLSLPDMDGLEVCRAIREFSDAYLIMLTARGDEVDRVIGLSVGADDYVTKPFSARELAARVRALRRRPRVAANPLREFGALQIDPVAREVILDGSPVSLTKIEFDLLDVLSAAPRRAFSREQLLKQIWGEWHSDDHVIDVHIGNLRRKLGESAAKQRYIRTVRGVGFRFEA